MQENENNSAKTISRTLKRVSIINGIVVVELILLIIYGWQIFSIKKTIERGGSKVISAQKIDDTNVRPSGVSAQPPALTGKVPPPGKTDHYKGDKEARITLIEYADFECPFCKRFHPTAQQAVNEYGGQVNWIYRHFPLSFHANAQKEGEGAECAGEIGGNKAFWKFTYKIFERTTSNGRGFALNALVPLAEEIGLNKNKFQDCLDSGKYAQRVQQDMTAGVAAGVTGTPGTFIYDNETGRNQLVPGALPYTKIKPIIDLMLRN